MGLEGYKDDKGEPVLLIVDDAERLLLDPKDGRDPETVLPEHQPLLKALLRAFDPARTPSRLLLTCRYRFKLLDGTDDLARHLHALQLRPMHEAALAKIADRTAPGDDAERLRPRAVAAACGSPGLLEPLTRAIAQEPDRAKQLLGEMEAFLQRKGPADGQGAGHLSHRPRPRPARRAAHRR